MTARPSLGFLLAFAWQDLLDRRARGTTAVLLTTIAIVTALAIVSLYLPQAAEQVRLTRLKQDPLALALWCWDIGGDIGVPLTESRLRRVQADLNAAVGPENLRGFFPFDETTFDFRLAGPLDRPGEYLALRGRTIAPGDPLPNALAYRNGNGFSSPDQQGLIVTPRFLELLGYSTDLPVGSELRLQTKDSGKELRVAIVGVTQDRLPLGHSFLITADFQQRLRMTAPDVRVQSVRSGAVSEEWPRPKQLDKLERTKSVWAALQEFRIARPLIIERIGKPNVWEFTSEADTPPPASLWRIRLKRIGELLEEAGYPASPEFAILDLPEVKSELPPHPGYARLALYARDLPVLKPMVETIRKADMQCNEGVVQQLESYHEAAEAGRRALLGILLVVLITAGVNIVAIQSLRMRQKRAEIGMLRAIGMNRRTLILIYTFEAFFLWLFGTLGGAILTGIVGVSLGYGVLTPEERLGVLHTADFPSGFLILPISFLLCWGALLFAGRFAWRDSPAVSLAG